MDTAGRGARADVPSADAPVAPTGYPPPQAYPYGLPPRQPAYPGGPHPDGIPPSKTMAGWALGLCIVGCTAITWLIGVVLAIVVLVESHRDPRDRGKGMAIGALVIAGCWVVVLFIGIGLTVASAPDSRETAGSDPPVVERRTGNELPQVAPAELRVGDCFDDAAVSGLDTHDDVPAGMVTVVPCERLHDLEAYRIVELDGETYPGVKQVRRTADDRCAAGFKAYVGVSVDRSTLDFWYYYPTGSSWRLGDHAITCVAGDPGAKTEDTLKGTRK